MKYKMECIIAPCFLLPFNTIIKTFVRFLMAHTTHWNTHVHIWRRHRTHTHTHTHAGRPEVAVNLFSAFSHPGPSFLKDPPGAVGSFAAPGDQVK